MQLEIDDQTDDDSDSTKPVAPGTTCYDCWKPSRSNLFSFLL